MKKIMRGLWLGIFAVACFVIPIKASELDVDFGEPTFLEGMLVAPNGENELEETQVEDGFYVEETELDPEASYHNRILPDVENYPDVNDWTYYTGEVIELHFQLFAYGTYKYEKYYIGVYNSAGELLATNSGYYSNTLQRTKYTLTWDKCPGPGEYYIVFYSTYQDKGQLPFLVKDGKRPVKPSAEVKAFVSRMYTVALGRAAESKGLEDWSYQLANKEIDGSGIAQGFIGSDEFTNRNLSDSDYVDVLYKTFFDRTADAGGKANWLNSLQQGYSRNYVLAGFVNSNEFAILCNRYGITRGNMEADATRTPNSGGVKQYVLRMYTKALKREGENAGVNDWTNRITSKIMTAEDVAKSFFFSEEFVNKNLSNDDYVETLYETFMDRPSDAAGKSDWVSKLNAGASRSDVLEGFSRSAEFGRIMASFGL